MSRSKTATLLVSLALTTISISLPPSAAAQVAGGDAREIGFSGHATIHLQVRDRAEAIEWFSRVLGFEHLFTEESLNWAEIASPVANVTSTGPGRPSKPGAASSSARRRTTDRS